MWYRWQHRGPIFENGLNMSKTKGSKDLAPRDTLAKRTAEAAVQGGVTPLDIMLHTMRRSWAIAQRAALEGNEAREMEYLSLAVEHAVVAAPYCHPRLASVAVKGDSDTPLQIVIRRLTPEAA